MDMLKNAMLNDGLIQPPESNCTTCKFEPEWGKEIGCGEYVRRCGCCRWEPSEAIPTMVAIKKDIIPWFVADEHKPGASCPAWRPK